MPEKIPRCPPEVPRSGEDLVTRTYTIRLATPMFGGGVEPGEPDADFPIRATAIRGHLRYWWRVVKGYSLGEQMWRREEEIFGSTEFPSPVRIRVEALSKVATLDPRSYRQASPEAYTLFAAIENEKMLVQPGLMFGVHIAWRRECWLQTARLVQNKRRLKLNKPPLSEQIFPIDDELDLAIHAWFAFGGIGARTRRGCGALQVDKALPPLDNHKWSKHYFSLESQIERVYRGRPCKNSIDAWQFGLRIWRQFRQPLSSRDGPRVRFPEAETIRRATKSRARRAKIFSLEAMPNGFPRAELGLPIGFQFKDESSGDPKRTILIPSGLDANGKPLQRMASPLILRPATLDNGFVVPTIIWLKFPIATQVDLVCSEQQKNAIFRDFADIRGPFFASYPDSPLAASPSGSAIEAFIEYAKSQGFKEVTL